MADIDPELRAAIVAYIRSWGTAERMAQHGDDGEGFLQFVDGIIEREAARTDSQSLVDMFRMAHDELGRYPTPEDLNRPGGPTLLLIPKNIDE